MTKDWPRDALLFSTRDMAEPEAHSIAGGRAVVYCASCPAADTPNEDAAALIPIDDQSAVLAVADGLGGTRLGEQAARIVIDALRISIESATGDGQEPRTGILNAIEGANQHIRDLGKGAATTLALAEIRENTIRPYHVGDSAVLVLGQRGKIKLQTIAHSPVGFAQEAGLMDETEALNHEDRHIVSNVIGAADMRVEVGSALKLAMWDTVLLASDGLLDNLRLEEIVSMVRKGPIEKGASRLAAVARQRMERPEEGKPSKPDDLTFVVFRPGRTTSQNK